MNRKKIKRIIPWVISLTPLLVAAQTIQGFILRVSYYLGLILPVLIILASIVFIWGVVTFITAAGNEEKRSLGKKRIFWGLIGLFVIIAFWGIIAMLVNSFGLPDQPPILGPIPEPRLLNAIIEQILNPFIGLMFVLASVIFVWGIIDFIGGAGNEEKRSKGKKHIIWGIVGLFIMMSAWGIIALLTRFWQSFS